MQMMKILQGSYDQLVDGQPHEHYLLKDGFMLMHGRSMRH